MPSDRFGKALQVGDRVLYAEGKHLKKAVVVPLDLHMDKHWHAHAAELHVRLKTPEWANPFLRTAFNVIKIPASSL